MCVACMCVHACACVNKHAFMCRGQTENYKVLRELSSILSYETTSLPEGVTCNFDQVCRPVRPWGPSVSVPPLCCSSNNTGIDHLDQHLKPGLWRSELSVSHSHIKRFTNRIISPSCVYIPHNGAKQ